MKPQSAVNSSRCSHRTASGRQCRQLSTDSTSGLCPQHFRKQKAAFDLTEPLLDRCQGFQTAQGINFALSNLFVLLAANRISTRRASVLAYINSLLLRTLPAIDADQEAGVVDPYAAHEPDTVAAGEANSPANPVPTVSNQDAVASPAPRWPVNLPEPDATKMPA